MRTNVCIAAPRVQPATRVPAPVDLVIRAGHRWY